ncbi:MAG: 3-deoxy-D-manno-octulosonic acid transferase [Ignavibacteriaceae bacterium]|nr:MAG: 3-deoxy-D-manno-octulosonic acid transferase [Ignavibacteriaceae bacterium]
MLLFLYNLIFIPAFSILMRIAAIFNPKIKKGIEGRREILAKTKEKIAKFDRSRVTVWFHSSSLGEFEQAKPIIEHLKKQGGVNIFVTFFSPSGYENSVKYPHADAVSYLPVDTPASARKFIEILKPSIAIFMRYDIWPNFIVALKHANVPAFLVDATMRDNSSRLNPLLRGFHHGLYSAFRYILTISDGDLNNFLRFRLDPARVLKSGDTRFDRVHARAEIAKERKLIREGLLEGKKVIVAGSIWEEDEEVLLPSVRKLLGYNKDVVVILVPHEPTLLHLEKLENEFAGVEPTIRFSFLNSYNGERVILVDSIGILMTLYFYADIAFVGGSFKSNVHNTLEAAVYGIPVVFGPKIGNSQEAGQLAESGGGYIVKTKKEMYRVLRTLLTDDQARKEAGEKSRDFVMKNTGATSIIMEKLREVIKLP